jgi:G3E family GTPase
VAEFGDTADIESKSMTVSANGASFEEILELKNGCLCCSIKDNGLLAIQNLVGQVFVSFLTLTSTR